jgi:hypothetical protein
MLGGFKMNTPKRRIDWGEAIIPGIALFFGIAYFIQVRGGPWVAIYWPVVLLIIVCPLWLMVVFSFVFSKSEPVERSPFSFSSFWEKGRKVAIVFFASIGYLVAIPYLGFSITNFCFLILIFRILGSRKWSQNIVIALIIVVALHVGLVVLMRLRLPQLSIGGYTI